MEKFVTLTLRYGTLVLGLGAILNLYLVLKHFELTAANIKAESHFQQLANQVGMRRQLCEGVIRDFLPRAQVDPAVLQILQQHQLVTTNAPGAGR